MVCDGVGSVHKVIPINGCRASFESECVLGCIDDDGDDPIRLTEQDRENILGVVSGERDGRVGGRGEFFLHMLG